MHDFADKRDRLNMKGKIMPKYTISKAVIENADEIGKIAYQVALLHYQNAPDEFKKPTLKNQTEYIKKSIADKNVLVLNAKKDEKIVGYVIVYFNTLPKEYFCFEKRAFIGSIAVDENYRGQGIGTALLQAVETQAKKKKIFVVEIDVYTFNQYAEKLYNKLGYQDIKHYKKKILK